MDSILEQSPLASGDTMARGESRLARRRIAARAGTIARKPFIVELTFSAALCLLVIGADAQPVRADGAAPNLSCISEEPLPDEVRRDCEKIMQPQAGFVPEPPPPPPQLIDPVSARHDSSSKGGMGDGGGLRGDGYGSRGDGRDATR